MDNCPSHVSKLTRAAMRKRWPHVTVEPWPAQSPDLSPLDSGLFPALMNSCPTLRASRSLDEVRMKVTQACAEFKGGLHLVHGLWPRRLTQCLRAQGAHFEGTEQQSSSSSGAAVDFF